MDVKANLLISGKRGRFTGGRQGTDNGFGDLQILPLMFGWSKGDLKWQGTFGIYAPTGNFTKDALANVGKNYWTFEPGAAASYLSSKYGFELTAFTGFDFNTENGTTNLSDRRSVLPRRHLGAAISGECSAWTHPSIFLSPRAPLRCVTRPHGTTDSTKISSDANTRSGTAKRRREFRLQSSI
jgi:hypothetical protein